MKISLWRHLVTASDVLSTLWLLSSKKSWQHWENSASLPKKVLGCYQSMLSTSERHCPSALWSAVQWVRWDNIAVYFILLFFPTVTSSVNIKELVPLAAIYDHAIRSGNMCLLMSSSCTSSLPSSHCSSTSWSLSHLSVGYCSEPYRPF